MSHFLVTGSLSMSMFSTESLKLPWSELRQDGDHLTSDHRLTVTQLTDGGRLLQQTHTPVH